MGGFESFFLKHCPAMLLSSHSGSFIAAARRRGGWQDYRLIGFTPAPEGRTSPASCSLLTNDELLGSLPDAAFDGTGLMILDATDEDKMLHIYSGVLNGF
jgi:hypothetical protein